MAAARRALTMLVTPSLWFLICCPPAIATRGVGEKVAAPDLSKYNVATVFSCFDGRKTIPAAAVNDNYCDCVDGSDEPGTPACLAGRFVCRNFGYKEKIIASAMVDDGVCDCCDGSDEAVNGLCENTCEKMAVLANKEISEKLEKMKAGLAMKPALEEDGRRRIAEWQLMVEEGQRVLEDAKSDLHVLEQRAQRLKDNEESAKKCGSVKCLADAGFILEITAAAESSLADQPTDNQNAEVPKSNVGQDIAMRWGAKTGSEPEKLERLLNLRVNVPEDCEDIYKISPLVPDSTVEKPAEWAEEDDGPWDPLMKKNENFERAQTKAEERVKAAKTSIHEIEKVIQGARSNLDKGTEFDRKWAAYLDTCHSLKVDKYQYDVCFLSKVTQIDGGRHHDLGKFTSFGEDEEYMDYTNGASCPNGVRRRTRVLLKCSSETKISGFEETSMCEYQTTFENPISCRDEELDMLGPNLNRSHKSHDELR